MRNPWGCVPVRPIYAYDYGRLRLRKIPRTLAENAAVVRPRTHYPFLLQYAYTPAFSRASPSLTVDLGQATFMRRKVRPFPP